MIQCFGDVFEKNVDLDVFDDVLQSTKDCANDAPNDVNRPPLGCTRLEDFFKGFHLWHPPRLPQSITWMLDFCMICWDNCLAGKPENQQVV